MPRTCTVCGTEFTEGYYVDVGESEYFCSDTCLHAVYSQEEYDKLFDADLAYWSEWKEDE